MTTGSYLTPIYSRSQSEVQGDHHNSTFLPQRHNSQGWVLAFSTHTHTQASVFPASVLQFLVLKTRSFSKPSIDLRFGLPFKTVLGVRSSSLLTTWPARCILMKLTMSDSLCD
ncbi:hypothetical protein TNCV_3100851 [Trichonephila clavipes]|nr:hypothetical protein TNCV_3100851 [Trichonephila clavipes]